MPHCIIEITENLIPELNKNKLMKDVANAIFLLDCFKGDDIKVRIYPIQYSFLGIEEQEHSYATANIQIMENKTDDQLHEITNKVQNVLLKHIESSIGKTSITTQVSFLKQDYYKRYKNF